MTVRELNEINQSYWDEAEETMSRMMEEHPSVYAEVVKDQNQDWLRLPFHHQLPLETAVTRADRYLAIAQSDFSRRGGRAKKTGELTKLIDEIVLREPHIICSHLLARLKDWAPMPPIAQVNEDSIFLSSGRQSEISGLKDRLSRAKKKLRFRKTG